VFASVPIKRNFPPFDSAKIEQNTGALEKQVKLKVDANEKLLPQLINKDSVI